MVGECETPDRDLSARAAALHGQGDVAHQLAGGVLAERPQLGEHVLDLRVGDGRVGGERVELGGQQFDAALQLRRLSH